MSDAQTIDSRGDKRRSQRVMARLRIVARRDSDKDGLMSEVGYTLVVNAHGALLVLAMSVQPGEQLVIKNAASGAEAESRVVRTVGEQDQNNIAIAFLRPVPRFWNIDFPPGDWKDLAN